MNKLIAIGYTGERRCYLNIARDEAIRRYEASTGDKVGDRIDVSEVDFAEEIGAYDVWPSEAADNATVTIMRELAKPPEAAPYMVEKKPWAMQLSSFHLADFGDELINYDREWWNVLPGDTVHLRQRPEAFFRPEAAWSPAGFEIVELYILRHNHERHDELENFKRDACLSALGPDDQLCVTARNTGTTPKSFFLTLLGICVR